MYVIVFDRLSPWQSQDRLWLQPHFGWVKSFFFIVVSLLLYLIPENLEGQHSTQKPPMTPPKSALKKEYLKEIILVVPFIGPCKTGRTNFLARSTYFASVMNVHWAVVVLY